MSFNPLNQETYRQLRSIIAERTRPVVAWVGSGVSAGAGLPTWGALRGDLVSALQAKVDSLEESDDRSRLAGKLHSATHTTDLWVAFQILKEGLGATSWQEVIRTRLGEYDKAQIPEAYRLLWRLGIHGAISLNLDRLLTRALAIEFTGIAPNEFFGLNVANALPMISTPHKYVLCPHGRVEDAASWVLTRQDLSQLLQNDAYRSIMHVMVAAHTLMFVGISIDDDAVRLHLEALKKEHISGAPHFWLTHRQDLASDRLAENLGVRVVRYKSQADDHTDLTLLLQDILHFVPTEQVARPVALGAAAADNHEIPPPEQLARLDAEVMRKRLNARAKEILDRPGDAAYAEYEQFCSLYEEAIYRSWYIPSNPTMTELLGYKLEGLKATGAFGKVFRAVDAEGNQVALKLLHQDAHRNAQMLQSFRRGVRAMRILSERGVKGMVSFRDASEIPAVVVMDWIEGPNLHEVVEARQVKTWAHVLQIGEALGRIVLLAHGLPERVLHRDLRPRNVLLRDFWSEPLSAETMLTDFDLSWHLGAREKSIIQGAASVGYLAPEQLQRVDNVSTQNAAVDSYGLGMTLFFLVARRDPAPLEHRDGNWARNVKGLAGRFADCDWLSLPERFARLIIKCTQEVQHQRWDISQIVGELKRLKGLVAATPQTETAELVAEELIARALDGKEYEWNDDRLEATADSGRGLNVTMSAREGLGSVEFETSWVSQGDREHRSLMKWFPRAKEDALARLSAGGWELLGAVGEPQQLRIRAQKPVEGVRKTLNQDARLLSEVIQKVQPS